MDCAAGPAFPLRPVLQEVGVPREPVPQKVGVLVVSCSILEKEALVEVILLV